MQNKFSDSLLNKSSLLWHVIYTRGRYEKRIAEQITEQGIEIFFPLVKQLRQWKDRKKWVEIPLFPNYIFVKADEKILSEILHINGVLKSVNSYGKPVTVSNKQMSSISKLIHETQYPEVEFNLPEIGSDIKIISGPLKGISGKLMQRKGKHKICIAIEAINASILVDIDPKLIKIL